MEKFIVRHFVNVEHGDVLVFEKEAEFQSTPVVGSCLVFEQEFILRKNSNNFFIVHSLRYHSSGPIVICAIPLSINIKTPYAIREMIYNGWTFKTITNKDPFVSRFIHWDDPVKEANPNE